MTTTIEPRKLRPYQQEAVQAVFSEWGKGNTRTSVVLPTGAGKSSVIAAIAAVCYREYGLDVAMLAHRGELLDQMAKTVAVVDPTAPPVGIVRAEDDESEAPIVAASLQTLTNPDRLRRLGKRRVIIWDEVHHSRAASWEQVLRDLGGFDEGHYFCGMTATLRRDDGKALRDIIQSVAYEKDLKWAIDNSFLVMPSGLTVRIPHLDLDKVKVSRGDFQNNELAEVMEAANPYIVEAVLKNAPDRRPIIFAASVDAAHGLAAALTDKGLPVEAVTGAMSLADRQPIYERYRCGITKGIATVQVLTEGADFPMCDCVVIARPTRSQNLYSQMVGRALRTHPDKTDALVLDLVGTTRVLKLVTLSDLDCGAKSKPVNVDGSEREPDEEENLEPIGAKPPKVKRMGAVDMVGIDLLAAENTDVIWLSTINRHIPFLQPTGSDWFIFLWPRGEGMYSVGWMPTKTRQGGGWLYDDREPVSLDKAKSRAEQFVVDNHCRLPKRTAPWRKVSKPSDGQLRFATSLGIPMAEDMSRARMADEITIRLVSHRLEQ